MRDESVKAAALTIPLEDAGLVEQCRNGDLAAFGRLVTKYQDRVLNVCWRMCGSRETAEDLTQEAFVRAFESLEQFAGRSQFSTWVFRIAINLAISAKRKQRNRRTLSLDDDRGGLRDGTRTSGAERLASPEATPVDRLLGKEQQGRVVAALAEIEEESRSVVVLRDVEGLGYDEIAEILDIPVGTVKSRLHRARLTLRDRVAGREETA